MSFVYCLVRAVKWLVQVLLPTFGCQWAPGTQRPRRALRGDTPSGCCGIGSNRRLPMAGAARPEPPARKAHRARGSPLHVTPWPSSEENSGGSLGRGCRSRLDSGPSHRDRDLAGSSGCRPPRADSHLRALRWSGSAPRQVGSSGRCEPGA